MNLVQMRHMGEILRLEGLITLPNYPVSKIVPLALEELTRLARDGELRRVQERPLSEDQASRQCHVSRIMTAFMNLD